MLSWSAIFLIIAAIAAVLAYSSTTGAVTTVAWVMLIVGITVTASFVFTGSNRQQR